METCKKYSIQEISDLFSLPASTLRYYEDQGLLPPVPRTNRGQRIYSQEHILRLHAIDCFKNTGLPLSKIRDFFEYEKEPELNIDKLIEIVTRHEQSVTVRLEEMKKNLIHIRQKVQYYNAVKKAYENRSPLPCFGDFADTHRHTGF